MGIDLTTPQPPPPWRPPDLLACVTFALVGALYATALATASHEKHWPEWVLTALAACCGGGIMLCLVLLGRRNALRRRAEEEWERHRRAEVLEEWKQ